MDAHADERSVLRQYLLGELPADSHKSVEETLLTDADFYQELLIVEDDLVDEYLAGTLPAGVRERFESHFLVTPARRQKLTFTSAFRKYVAAEAGESETIADEAEATAGEVGASRPVEVGGPRPVAPSRPVVLPFYARRPALAWALAATLLLAVSATFWIATKNRRAPGVPAAGIAGNVFPVELTTGAVRQGGETKRIAPPADTGVVRLGLELPAADHQSYQAVLKADDGRVILTRDDLRARAEGGGPSVAFDVPAELLTRGDYRVTLRGQTAPGASEDVANYSFRVAR